MTVNDSFRDADDDESTFQESEISLSRSFRFWLLLFLNIPSVICSFFLLFHFINNKNLRCQLINHITIILLMVGLIIQLFDIPFHLSFLHINIVLPSIPSICLFWWFMDIGLYNGSIILMAYGSFERYLVIYHDQMFTSQRKRFLFHYLPLIVLILYILIFYIIVIIFPPCMNSYDYILPVCNDFPCYLNEPILGIWDSIVNNILPTIIISICGITLVLRIYWQKRRLHRHNIWRRQCKMTIHLLCTSVLYLVPNLPLNILIFAHLCGLPDGIGVEPQLYFDFLCYFVTLLYPFVCLGSISEINKKIKWRTLFFLKKPERIATIQPQ